LASRAIGWPSGGDRHFAQSNERIAQYTSRNSAPGQLLRCASRHADHGAFSREFIVFAAICPAQNARGVPRQVKCSEKTGRRVGSPRARGEAQG
jgi:hypothetical protein